MPRARRNPATEAPSPLAPSEPVQITPTQQPLPPVGTNAPNDNPYSGIALEMPLSLPEGFSLELPDFSHLAQGAIGTAETGFAPNPELPRVTDADREVHAVVFKEQMNAAANLQDSIRVATAYVDAAVEATKLGKSVVRYQTGVEDIRTAQVKLQQAQTKTSIAREQLTGLQHELNYLTSENVHRLDTFNAKLDQWRVRVQGEQLKTTELTHQIETKYAHIIGTQGA